MSNNAFTATVLAVAIVLLGSLLVTNAVTPTHAHSDSGVRYPIIILPSLNFGHASLRPHISHETINLHYNGHQQAYVSGLSLWFSDSELADHKQQQRQQGGGGGGGGGQQQLSQVAKLYAAYLDEMRAAEVAAVQNAAADQLGDASKRTTATKRFRSFIEFLALTLPPSKNKNLAGQVYNHALYFQSLTDAPVRLSDYVDAYKATSRFSVALIKQFGSADAFIKEFTATAVAHFGSGWVWLVAVRNGDKDGEEEKTTTLKIVDTHDAQLVQEKLRSSSNADDDADGSNNKAEIVPLLVLDVWEHAYYVDHRNKRATYVSHWFNVVDWGRVEKRFAAANIAVKPQDFSEEEKARRMLTQAIAEDNVYPHFL